VIENLLSREERPAFIAVALSLAGLQLLGFLAVPDTALVFATALFFASYRKFISTKTMAATIMLGISCAILLYSKYHGALVVLFTLFSNLRLLKDRRIYLAGLIAVILFGPHVWWQYQHDWMSFRYHLFESNVNVYEPGFTLSYLAGQLLLAGPVAGFLLIPAALLYKPADRFERALKFTLAGIYIFFLLSSFRGKVEINWTVPVWVPLLILSVKYWVRHEKWRKALLVLLPLSLVVTVGARIIMVADILPSRSVRSRFHAWKEWPAEMRSRTENLPVVFSNSYQRASKYWFYTGQMAYSQNHYKEHRNQFNFWPLEDSMLGRRIYYLDVYDLHRMQDSLKTPIGWVGFRSDPRFESFAKIQFIPEKKKYTASNGTLHVNARVEMPEAYKQYIRNSPYILVNISLAVFGKKGWIKDIQTDLFLRDLLQGSVSLAIPLGLDAGNYQLLFTLAVRDYYPTHNSSKFALRVTGY
jgi:hypothetical protein